MLSQEEILKQVQDHFTKNGYKFIRMEKPFGITQFLAKDLKTGVNESFLLSNDRLFIFVHTGRKNQPWIWKEVLQFENETQKNTE